MSRTVVANNSRCRVRCWPNVSGNYVLGKYCHEVGAPVSKDLSEPENPEYFTFPYEMTSEVAQTTSDKLLALTKDKSKIESIHKYITEQGYFEGTVKDVVSNIKQFAKFLNRSGGYTCI